MNLLKQPELYTDRLFHGDIEACGYLSEVKEHKDVWCLVLKDDESKRRYVFHDYPEYDGAEVEDGDKTYTIQPRDGDLISGIRFMYKAGISGSKFAIHNLQTYDRPLIEKIWPKCLLPEEAYIDTFVQSKIQYFDRPCPKGARSSHGLDAYARLSGDTHKPKVLDFSIMNAYMLHRCIMDVDIQEFCTNYLAREFAQLKNIVGIDLTDALKMENEYTITCHEQETYGALVDKPHMEHCVEVWDKRLQFLEEDIVPRLPPTVKAGTGTKVTRTEMAILLGYPKKVTDKMIDPTETKKLDGEIVTVPVKPYYKPTMKYTVDKKANQYSGMHISYGFSPSFLKKKELTDWIKENHGDTKSKDWSIEKQELVTTLLNSNTCKYFGLEPEDIGVIGGYHTRVKFEESRLTQHEIVKGYLIKSGIKHVQEWNFKKDDNGFVKAEFDTVVSYPPKAAPENQLHYKVKKGETLVSSPKIGEKDYPQLKDATGQMVGEYNTTMHRRRFLLNPRDPEEKGLLANIRPDGRLPCGVNNSSTGTLRSSHRIWVNAPGAGSLYGEEIRRCIIAPEGRKLISSDMNSAQLSLASYYANNYEYFKSVCYGNEFKVDDKGNEVNHPDTGKPWYLSESGHCANSRAFELFSKEESDLAVKTQDQGLIHELGLKRKKSKAATFGVIFGCSGKKLATMLGIDEALGAQKKEAFLSNIGLDRPIAILDQMCEKNKRGRGGYIELPFGFFAFCSSPHARFNYLD